MKIQAVSRKLSTKILAPAAIAATTMIGAAKVNAQTLPMDKFESNVSAAAIQKSHAKNYKALDWIVGTGFLACMAAMALGKYMQKNPEDNSISSDEA